MKFGIWIFFETLLINFKFHQYFTWLLGTLYEDVRTFMTEFRSVLLRVINLSGKFVQKIKTHILYSTTFSRKSCHLWDNVQKSGVAGQAADDNMAHALCLLYNWSYRHTLRICITYCFSTATMVMRTRLNVMLYAYCLSCVFSPRFWIGSEDQSEFLDLSGWYLK